MAQANKRAGFSHPNPPLHNSLMASVCLTDQWSDERLRHANTFVRLPHAISDPAIHPKASSTNAPRTAGVVVDWLLARKAGGSGGLGA